MCPRATGPSNVDTEIGALYRRLAALSEAGEDAEYSRVLAELRVLQKAEAAKMQAYFDAHDPFPPGRLDDIIAKANKLLAETRTKRK